MVVCSHMAVNYVTCVESLTSKSNQSAA